MKAKLILFIFLCSGMSAHAVSKDLTYKSSYQVRPAGVMEQVYYVNQFYSFSHIPLTHQPKGLFTLIKKGPHTTQGVQFERYINFEQQAPVKAKDLIMITSGANRGASILITDYIEAQNPTMIQAWIPQLRKVRRIPEPPANDLWFGSAFTHGDMKHRKPHHETHEILGTKPYVSCAQGMQLKSTSRWYNYTRGQAPCVSHGREVVAIKSTPKDNYPADYDYRVSYVDAETYADYKTEYYKKDKLVKFIEKNWLPVEMPMPRAQVFSHWYVKDLVRGTESLLLMMPLEKTTEAKMWTEGYLRKSKR